MVLLEKLLSSDYFVQKTDGEWGPDGLYLGPEGGFGRDPSSILDPMGAGQERPGFGKNKDEFEVGEGYNRREKRAINIKLSRYIGRINDSNETPRDIENYLSELKEEDLWRINPSDLVKLNETKTDKSYYDEKMIEKSFQHVLAFLKNYSDKESIDIDKIDHEQLDSLVNAVSFSLNGVHYQQKFRKTSYMIHPYDL
jgi:phage-related protein